MRFAIIVSARLVGAGVGSVRAAGFRFATRELALAVAQQRVARRSAFAGVRVVAIPAASTTPIATPAALHRAVGVVGRLRIGKRVVEGRGLAWIVGDLAGRALAGAVGTATGTAATFAPTFAAGAVGAVGAVGTRLAARAA